MQLFQFTAKDKNGTLQKGELEAENESAAAKLLLSRDLTPILVNLAGSNDFDLLGRISLKDKALIARQLATMITAGLPISQSLKTLQEQTNKKSVNKMLDQVASNIEGGSTLASSFSQFPNVFNNMDITLISSGETGGTLDKALNRLADNLEKEQALVRKVRGAFVYPVFVLVVTLAIMIWISIAIMPMLEGVYSSFNVKLPILTRGMIWLSHFLIKFGFLVAIGVVAAVFGLVSLSKTNQGRRFWDHVKFVTPGIKLLLKKLYMARLTRTLSGLVASGVPLIDALKITADSVGNSIYKEDILESAEQVKTGVALSDTLKDFNLYPPVVSEMVSVGEKTGELDKMLSNLADYFDAETEALVKNISDLIQPLIILVLGGIIGLLLVAVLFPIYGLSAVAKIN